MSSRVLSVAVFLQVLLIKEWRSTLSNFESNKLMKHGNIYQALAWNMVGVCFLYLCRWLVSVSVVRLSADFISAGILILAISITNIWNTVAFFSVRNIQVSDINCEFSDGEYIATRVFTVTVAAILCAAHVITSSQNVYQWLVTIVLMLFIISLAFADVMHGILQKKWRMDLIGISNILKGILLLVSFVILFIFFDLLTAVIGMTVFSFLVVLLYDMPYVRKYTDIRISFSFIRILQLIKTCFPLFIVSLLFILIPSLTRIALERQTNTEMLGIYGSVTLPAAMAQTVALSAFAPIVNMFTKCFSEKDYKGFLRIFWIGLVGVTAVFLLFFILSFPFGGWLLDMIFDTEAAQYANLFSEAILFSMFVCLGWFIALPLIVLRKTIVQVIVYGGGAIVCIVLLPFMISAFGVSGANYVQILVNALIFIALFCVTIVISKKEFIKQ